MLKPQGYVTVTTATGPLQEYDTVTCGHCNRVVLVKPRTASTVYLVPDQTNVFGAFKEEPGAGCRVCMRAVCLACERDGRCLPLERRIEQMEQRSRFAASVRG